ncbi:histidine triad (HIT) family protein [Roseimicrobium gellanilyticum]|uniref:Histidine triad (HIT) family protein n=1 Tax=Roseimicrobium gellanilyticum TaxID=748857 RepID=A0A366HVW6_9BACT|nr:histidine triad (HIT) family protein [Roseimicrobium gellanilyticum]
MQVVDFYCDQVLSGKVSVQKLVETEHVLAFHHTQPYWPVHLVIIPKKHIGSLATVEGSDFPIVDEMLRVAADLCRQVTGEHGGCRLSTNSGDYQSTKHLHFYIHHGARLKNEDGSPATGSQS